ncbi:MAG: 4Fe-4S dicluster domain-containing protein [Desulfovibrionaceae bacterium]
MAKNPFQLDNEPKAAMREAPAPGSISLALAGYRPEVAPGDSVRAGQLVARAENPLRGDLYSPVRGTVREIHGLTEFRLIIDADRAAPADSSAPDEAADPAIPPAELSSLSGEELRRALAGLGIDARPLGRARTLIINAMPPEPGILVNGQLLKEHRAVVALGLETAKRAVSPGQVVLAGIGVDASALGSCAVKHLPAAYPAGLDPLVIRAVTGNEDPAGCTVLSVLELYLLGLAAETGRPVTRTVLTVDGVNVLAPVGMPVGPLLEQAGLAPRERDRVVMGGPLRGVALSALDEGIAKDALCLSLIPAGAFPPVADHPCINCGECVLRCPSRVLPNLISRAAEFRFWDRAEGYGALECMECGLCGYFCPGRRPLLQYIRLAKSELALLAKELPMQPAGTTAAEEASK